MGIMKGVGQAVRNGQSFCWDKDRMAHVLRCIGIAPWGYVKDRRDLAGKKSQVSTAIIVLNQTGKHTLLRIMTR